MHKVLFVDDDQNILNAYKRAFRKNASFSLYTALGAKEGIETLRTDGPFAIVISDQQMPEVQGVAFLASVKKFRPEAIRMMLTGNADQETAMEAVNTGSVFRFLTKPCSPEELSEAIEAAIRQYNLENAERDLLEKTLAGSVKVLVDLISLHDEKMSARIARMRGWARELVSAGHVGKAWELDMAVLLSPIGEATLPADIAAKRLAGETLDSDEAFAVERAPDAGQKLIGNIPRLESVGKVILYQDKGFDGSGFPHDDVKGKSIPGHARVLKILKDLAAAWAMAQTADQAFAEMYRQVYLYDQALLDLVTKSITFDEPAQDGDERLMAVGVGQIKVGDVLAENLLTKSGSLALSVDHVVTEPVLQKIENFRQTKGLREPVKIIRKKSTIEEGEGGTKADAEAEAG